MAEEETQVPILEAASFEELSKKEMVEHLVELHGYTSLNGNTLSENTKLTKDQLVATHARFHKILDSPDKQKSRPYNDNVVYYYYLAQRPSYYVREPITWHTHTAVVPPEEILAQAKAIQEGRLTDKILTPAERKTLTELVNNDFASVAAQIKEMAAADLAQKMQDLLEEDRDMTGRKIDIRNHIDRLIQDTKAAINLLADQVRDEGLTVSVGGFSPAINVTNQKYQDRLKQVQDENRTMLNTALTSLERQRLGAIRRILLSGVTEDAAKLLQTIPSAQELMGMNKTPELASN